MSKNVEINYFNGSTYEVLYPKTTAAQASAAERNFLQKGVFGVSATASSDWIEVGRQIMNVAYSSARTTFSISGVNGRHAGILTFSLRTGSTASKLEAGTSNILNSSLNLAYDNSVALDLTTNDFKNYVFVVIEVNCKTISNIDCSLRTGATDTGADKVVYMYNQYNILNSYYGSDGFIINDFLYNNTTVIKVGNRTNVTLYLKNECENNDTINHIAVYGFTV